MSAHAAPSTTAAHAAAQFLRQRSSHADQARHESMHRLARASPVASRAVYHSDSTYAIARASTKTLLACDGKIRDLRTCYAAREIGKPPKDHHVIGSEYPQPPA